MGDRLKVIVDMRPALDGHSGIPHETRLLFKGLGELPSIEVLGLIQSSNLALEAGLPLVHGRIATGLSDAEQVDRLSKVVVSLQQGPSSHRLEHRRKVLLARAGPPLATLGSMLGRRVRLTGFRPEHFRDYVWRALFSKSLPVTDFDAVTTGEFRVLRWPWSVLNAVGVLSAGLGHAFYPRLDTEGLDILIAETPFPGRVSPPTRMVVRYHDAIPLLMPHTIKHRGHHRAMHFHALKRNAADGAWFACVSDATRRDLLKVMPALEDKSVTIPNMISHHFRPESEPAARVAEIMWSRKNRRAPHGGGAAIDTRDLQNGQLPFLLMVSTVEPRKNHLALLDAWELLRSNGFPQLNLVCVGNLGWESEGILQRFGPWLDRGGLHLLEDVPAPDLRLLYRHAAVTVCPSLAEGFDFAGVEAMRCGGVVAASAIDVHRDVYGGAAVYFSPYAPEEMARVLAQLMALDAESQRMALRSLGQAVSAQYLPERVLPLWDAFLRQVAQAPDA
jgi:glycosyltransferase involved in cell wall biosynthesis